MYCKTIYFLIYDFTCGRSAFSSSCNLKRNTGNLCAGFRACFVRCRISKSHMLVFKGSVSQNFYTLAFPINQALTYILFVYLLRPTQIVSLNLYFADIFSICQLAACLLLTIKYDFKQLSFLMYRIHQI